jgi:hypothetical protein
MKRLIVIVCVVILLGAGLCLLLRPARPAPLAPVIVMPLPYSIPRQKVSMFDRWVPRQASWAWVWRVKETLVGRPRICNLRATFVDCTGSGESLLTNVSLAKPQFTHASGLRIWLLSEDVLGALNRDLRQAAGTEVLASPRIITASGMQASLCVGGTFPIKGVLTPVGLTMDFLPQVRPDATDITAVVELTEAITNQAGATATSSLTNSMSIRTNLAVAARIQLPKGTGVFLLDGPPAAADGKRVGVLLSISTQKPK